MTPDQIGLTVVSLYVVSCLAGMAFWCFRAYQMLTSHAGSRKDGLKVIWCLHDAGLDDLSIMYDLNDWEVLKGYGFEEAERPSIYSAQDILQKQYPLIGPHAKYEH